MGNLKNELLTGCSRGIGYGLVETLLNNNNNKYYIIASCRSPSKQNKLRGLISSYPNNAGISVSNHPYESVLDFNPKEMLNVFKTNVVGTALLVKTYIDLLKSKSASNPSKVINMSSELSSLTKAFNGYQKGNNNR